MAASSQLDIRELLNLVASRGASDLHLSVGRYPTLRIDGKLAPLIEEKRITPERNKGIADVLLTDEQKKLLDKYKDIDLSYDFEGKARFRINIFNQKGYLGIAFRLIPVKIRTIEELRLPFILKDFTTLNQGFVLIVGPSGHGKSTTMAALVDLINHTRSEHIITIEDPIEYIFTPDKCIINQRELHKDAISFPRALRAALREDPNIVVVGEMRDLETIETAITVAETGHLVFATLHTNDASQTVDRVVDVFPPHQQPQIRTQLAAILSGIVSQRLISRTQGGRVVATEVLLVTGAVRNIIREGKTHQLSSVIQTSAEEGMIPLNKSLAELVKSGEIKIEDALLYSLDPRELKSFIK